MRVLQLCCDPGVAYGGTKGASVHLAELARALGAEGAEVLLAVTRVEPGAPPPPPGVSVEVLPGPGRDAPPTAPWAVEPARVEWLSSRLAHGEVDVLYERLALHTAAGATAAAAAAIPHVVELNAPLPLEAARYRTLEDPERARRLERRVLGEAGAVLAVSRPLARYAAAAGARRVEVSPNAVDPTRFPSPARADAGPPLAVFAGSLRPWHGTDTLAAAWALLGREAPPLLVVGDGDGRDRLEAAGAQVTGVVSHDDVAPLLVGAQIGLAPYAADSPSYFSPLKLFEYLAAGLAVVAADIPGVMDVAGDVVVPVPPGDAAALAAAVADLVADPRRRAVLGRAGRALVLSDHTWAHRARRLLGLAAELRPAGSRRPPVRVPAP